MKTSKILTKAKEYLCLGGAVGDNVMGELYQTQFMCLAIANACRVLNVSTKKRNATTAIVGSRIKPQYTILDWLYENEHISKRQFKAWDKDHDYVPYKLQDYRHAWLDHLINEFKDKGD